MPLNWKYNIDKQIISCRSCQRLIDYRNRLTSPKRHMSEKYWSLPLCGIGDLRAQVFIIGLAPAAHGGNRTGRMFTGDQSGDWLMRALYISGFSSQPYSLNKEDGLILFNVYITGSIRCAPPENKPNKSEILNCISFLQNEYLNLSETIKVIITLGKIAFDTFIMLLDKNERKGLTFGHGKEYLLQNNKTLISSFHPSRQNTNTKKLTWDMWIGIFDKVNEILRSAIKDKQF